MAIFNTTTNFTLIAENSFATTTDFTLSPEVTGSADLAVLGTVIAGTEDVLMAPYTGEPKDVNLLTANIIFTGEIIGVLAETDVDLLSGSFVLTGQRLAVNVDNLAAHTSEEPHIQETQDTYYLTDNLQTFQVDYYPYHSFYVGLDLVESAIPTLSLSFLADMTPTPGVIDASYLTDFYFRIHLSIEHLDVGNALAQATYTVYIWNSYFVDNNLISLDPISLDNISIDLGFTIPHVFTPLMDATATISVSPIGSPYIDGQYDFNFAFGSAILYITGKRVVLWPFGALAEFTETRNYLTDVIPCTAGEIRYDLSETSRLGLTQKNQFLGRGDYAEARIIAHGTAQLALGIPLWTDAMRLTGVTPTDTFYFDTTHVEMQVGTLVILWAAYNNAEVLEIKTIAADHIVTKNPCSGTYTKCWVVPLYTGNTQSGISFNEDDKRLKTASAEILCTQPFFQQSWTTPTTFQGLNIFDKKNIVKGGLEQKYARETVDADGLFGNISRYNVENYNRTQYYLQEKAETKAELFALRRKFDYLKGRYTPFFVPSMYNDLIAAADMSLGSTALTLTTSSAESYPPKYIRVTGQDPDAGFATVIQCFEVTGVANPVANTFQLTLSTGAATRIFNISKIEILTKMRLDSDKIDIQHKHKVESVTNNRFLSTVKVPVKEVIS